MPVAQGLKDTFHLASVLQYYNATTTIPFSSPTNHLLVRLDAGVLDGGSALEVLLEPQLKGLANGGDDVLCQAAPTLQNKACTAIPSVLGHICNEVQCVLWKGWKR